MTKEVMYASIAVTLAADEADVGQKQACDQASERRKVK